MTQEKTEKPSRRKIKTGREEGRVVYSSELTAAIVLLAALFLIWLLQPFLNQKFVQLFNHSFHTKDPIEGLTSALKIFVWPTLLLMGTLFLLILFSHFIQKGWVWKRRQKKEAPFILSAPIKVILIGVVGFFTIRNPSSQLLPSLFSLVLRVAMALLIFGFADLIYQKWRFYRKMQMTKHEVKEEQREEGGGHAVKKWTKSNYRQK